MADPTPPPPPPPPSDPTPAKLGRFTPVSPSPSAPSPAPGARARRDRSTLFAVIGAVVVVALVAAAGAWFLLGRPGPSVPVAGTWVASLSDGKGAAAPCSLHVLASGIAALDDTCPAPWRDYRGVLAASADTGKETKGQFALLAPGMQPLLGGYLVASGQGASGGARLEMRGAPSATLDWQRQGDVAGITAGTVDLYPARAGWPIAGMPTLVDRARYLLQLTWRPDAVVMDVTFFARGNAFLAGVPPHYDQGDLRVTAYSPGSHSFRTFLGAALGSQDAPNYSVYQADPAFAVPANFLDLPEALRAAAQRGFSTDAIREASLRYWSLTGAAGAAPRVLGMGWLLQNTANQTIYLPALPGQGAVLCIQDSAEIRC